MEIKLKGGKKLKIRDVSIDERDELLDSVSYEHGTDGNILAVKMMHSTITKWLRLGLNGQANDEFILGLTFDERTEIFLKMQEMILTGEENAFVSK